MIEIGVNRFRSKAAASPEHNAGSGGDVDDFSKRLDTVDERLGKLDVAVAEIRVQMPSVATKAQVDAIEAQLRFLATKEEVLATRAQVDVVEAQLRFLATKAEVDAIAAQMPFIATKADLHAHDTRMIKWMIGTALSCATMAFAAAKLIH